MAFYGSKIVSIGSSGRVVFEINPELKRELYPVLMREGMTLKGWFIQHVVGFVAEASQLSFRLKSNERGIAVASDAVRIGDRCGSDVARSSASA